MIFLSNSDFTPHLQNHIDQEENKSFDVVSMFVSVGRHLSKSQLFSLDPYNLQLHFFRAGNIVLLFVLLVTTFVLLFKTRTGS